MRRTPAAAALAEVLSREGERLGVSAKGVRETVSAIIRMLSWRLHGACPMFSASADFLRSPLFPAAVLEVCADRKERSAWRAISQMVRNISPVFLGVATRVVGWFLAPSRFGPPPAPLGTPPGGRLLWRPMAQLPRVVVIVGPTASGKSVAGLGVARLLEGEVICADSRTIYRGMDIGTAKPAGERDWALGGLGAERPLMVEGVPHWGLDLLEPSETFSAMDFQVYADAKIADIVGRGKVPVVVGGTGLYVRAVMDRPTFSDVPPNPAWRAEFAVRPLEDLVHELQELDPLAVEQIDIHNRRRVERALEIVRATEGPLAAQRTYEPARYTGVWLGVDPGKEEGEGRLEERLHGMVADGLVDEVRRLVAVYGAEAPGLQTIGYREFLPFFLGQRSLKEVLADIRQHTKDYAKRQRTWWRKDERVTWFSTPHALVEAALRAYESE